jgi:hypothetical protein
MADTGMSSDKKQYKAIQSYIHSVGRQIGLVEGKLGEMGLQQDTKTGISKRQCQEPFPADALPKQRMLDKIGGD